MAELVGCVAAAAQVTGQLCSLTFQLKSLLVQIEKAPPKIQSLVEAIHFIGQTLAKIRTTCGTDTQSDGTETTQVIEYCTKAATILSNIVTDLNRKLQRPTKMQRKVAACKVVWKTKEVDDLEQRLAMSLSILQLHLQSLLLYQSLESQAALAKILPLLSRTSHFSHEQEGSARTCKETSIKSNDAIQSCIIGNSLARRRLRASLRTPSWICNTGWDFELVIASINWWQFNFRQYNYRKSNCEIFSVIEDGDLARLRSLFSQRAASPFDRDHKGRSLLHYAAATNQALICKDLLTMGLDWCIDEDLGYFFTPRQLSLLSPLLYCRTKSEGLAYMDLFQSFEHTTTEDYRFFLYGCSVGTESLDLLIRFQQHVAPLYFTLADEHRLQALRVYCFSGPYTQHPDVDVFQFLFRQDRTVQGADILVDIHGESSLIHSSVIAFGRASRRAQLATSENESKVIRWKSLLTEYYKSAKTFGLLHFFENIRHEYTICNPDLISRQEWSGTPFLSILKSTFIDYYDQGQKGINNIRKLFFKHKAFVQAILRQWLDVLVSCGVDLGAYGHEEHLAFAAARSEYLFELSYRKWRVAEQDFLKEKLTVGIDSFKYGILPQEWYINWVVPMDIEQLVGEFWKTIENSSTASPSFPGAWPL